MKKYIDTKELKEIQLDMLKVVHKFCVNNNIRYSLSSGTLIGAIRHKGYIPWDDDIDIMMPRPDYERFLNTFSHEYLIATDFSKDDSQPLTYGKVYDTRTVMVEKSDRKYDASVFLDVFVIDGLGSDISTAKKLYKKIKYHRDILVVKTVSMAKTRSFYRNIYLGALKVASCLFPFKYVLSRTIKLMKTFDFNSSKLAGNLSWGFGEKRIFNRNMYEEYIDVEFEGNMFRSLKDYDKYLSHVYGDYMKLPPKEKQVTHHVFEAWWK